MYVDLLTKIKNAQAAKKRMLRTRFSHMDKAVVDVLQRKGFVASVEVKGRPSKRFLYIDLRGKRPVEKAQFLSKPSVRRYRGYKEIQPVKGGYGLVILSTPKGIMSGTQARREKVGGQLLCKVW
jgi:small subunit ribosomal protein S8